MRQRITVENLAELSPEQQEKIKKLWKPKEWDLALISQSWGSTIGLFMGFGGENLHFHNVSSVPKNTCLPLLSIGQMIELLQENIRDIRLDPDGENSIQIYKDGDWGRKSYYVSLLNNDICNNLWQAVKEIL